MGETLAVTADFYAPDAASIEQLRSILEKQSGATVSFEDAAEVGTQLLAFYECLARERTQEVGDGQQ